MRAVHVYFTSQIKVIKANTVPPLPFYNMNICRILLPLLSICLSHALGSSDPEDLCNTEQMLQNQALLSCITDSIEYYEYYLYDEDNNGFTQVTAFSHF